MKTKYRRLQGMAALGAIATLAGAITPAVAQDTNYVPLFTYRTGAFASSGVPIANGMRDYLEMLNQRDGGIGGVKLALDECETGYDTKKGLECYEAVKTRKPVVVNPWSTGTTLPLIPKAAVDKIPVLSMAYGLSASAVGDTFPWVFNPPNTYWDGLSMILRYIGDKEGGIDKLKGKTIGYIYLDAGFGKEPLPMLETLAKEMGFSAKLYPVAFGDLQNQSSQWLGVRRDKPDYMIMYGWGAMNGTAIKEAARISFPMDKFISIWWTGEDDVRPAGDAAKGFKMLNWHEVGANYPAMQDILKHVVSTGKSQVTGPDKVGELLYARGVYNSLLIAEGIRNAQKLTGKKVITGEDMRRGLEIINLDAARLKEIGLEGFTGAFKLSCQDHNGHRPTFMQSWDGAKWKRDSGDLASMLDKVLPLIDAAAKDYAEKNAGWPKRTEVCDKAT